MSTTIPLERGQECASRKPKITSERSVCDEWCSDVTNDHFDDISLNTAKYGKILGFLDAPDDGESYAIISDELFVDIFRFLDNVTRTIFHLSVTLLKFKSGKPPRGIVVFTWMTDIYRGRDESRGHFKPPTRDAASPYTKFSVFRQITTLLLLLLLLVQNRTFDW